MAREVWSLSEWFVLGGEGVADKLCAGQFYKLRNLQYLYIVL